MPGDDRQGAERKEVEERVEKALKEAEIARRQRRYEDGIALLLDALDLGYKTDQVYYRLGNLYYDAGDLARAEYVYRRAIEANPYHANAHYNLAVVYKKTGRIHDSVRFHKRAVRLEATGRIGRALMGGDVPRFAEPIAAPGSWDPLSGPARSSAATAPPATSASRAAGGEGAGGAHEAVDIEAAPTFSLDDLRNDPEFRRWGRNMALKGLVLLAGVAVFYLIAMYLLGPYLF